MNRRLPPPWLLTAWILSLSILGGIVLPTSLSSAEADESPQLAHMVFFTLAEKTDSNRDALIAACQKHLSGHQGTVYFSVGHRAADLAREVNDQQFDVALHLVFASRADHDRYQTNPRHLQFIEQNKHLWSGVRVFDSYLAPRPWQPVPVQARNFAGMIRGRVIGKQGRDVIIQVTEVAKVWEHNKAESPESMIGKKILVRANRRSAPLARFLRRLKPNETVTLDVAHRNGRVLTLLELTDEQREETADAQTR